MKRELEDGALIEHCLADGSYCREPRSVACCAFYGCRVLVSKERLEQKWPTEKDGPEGAAFRKFAARLADAVQKALAEGVKIDVRDFEPDCRCPLGCLIPDDSHPDAYKCRDVGLLGFDQSRDFYSGFEDWSSPYMVEPSPYYRLGQAYRARFVRP